MPQTKEERNRKQRERYDPKRAAKAAAMTGFAREQYELEHATRLYNQARRAHMNMDSVNGITGSYGKPMTMPKMRRAPTKPKAKDPLKEQQQKLVKRITTLEAHVKKIHTATGQPKKKSKSNKG